MTKMRDVAEHAGVSVSTVSHVINETRHVSTETRQRVLGAMDALNYQPNRLARSLRVKKTQTIGMIVPDSSNPFFSEIARHIEDYCFEKGYSVILCNSDGDLDKELFYANVLVEKQVDGILFVAVGLSEDNILKLHGQKIPIMLVDRHIPNLALDNVLVDNRRGGWLATKHLIECGHQRIGCITGFTELTPSAERVMGYQQALEEHKLSIDETLIVQGDFHIESGYQRTQELLDMKQPPTALFCCNDLMAIGAMRAAVERGLRIPMDMAVVGFDNIPIAQFTNPPLTSIKQPLDKLGRLSSQLLIERIQENDLQVSQHMLGVDLIKRESSCIH